MDQKTASMSGGERKILGFAWAPLGHGAVLVLDEPSEGVQPENIHKMEALTLAHREKGAAILVLEQNVSMIVSIADPVQTIDTGGFSFTLERTQIRRDAVVRALDIQATSESCRFEVRQVSGQRLDKTLFNAPKAIARPKSPFPAAGSGKCLRHTYSIASQIDNFRTTEERPTTYAKRRIPVAHIVHNTPTNQLKIK